MKIVELDVIDPNQFDNAVRQKIKADDYPVVIKINEGPDLRTVRIFDKTLKEYLEQLILETKADRSKIYIEIDNLIHDKSFFDSMVINFTGADFDHAKELNFKIEKNLVKHFGLFVGCSRWPRLFLAAKLFDMAKNKSYISYQQKHYQSGQAANLGFDQMMIETQDKDNKIAFQFAQLNENLPLRVIDNGFENNNGGYINFTEAYDLLDLYNSFFVDMVCETWHLGKTFMPTEKIVRPLVSKTPFIVFGAKDYLKNLKKLGFMTFNAFWDESYDNFSGYERLVRIIKLVENIKNKSITELKDILKEMDETLDHNQQLYKKLYANDIIGKINGNP